MKKIKFLVVILLLFTPIYSYSQYRSSRFQYSGNERRMIRALTIADSILNLPIVYSNIKTHKNQQMDSTTFTMSMLADTLFNFNKPIKIRFSKSPFHWTANAGTTSEQISIFWTGYYEKHIILAITIIHEWVHGVDAALHGDLNLSFAHLDNQSPCASKNTASYRVEDIVCELLGIKSSTSDCQ